MMNPPTDTPRPVATPCPTPSGDDWAKAADQWVGANWHKGLKLSQADANRAGWCGFIAGAKHAAPQLERLARLEAKWQTGIPPVKEGDCDAFWVFVKNQYNPNGFVRSLFYANKHRMGLGENCYEAPACAVPVPDDDYEFEWTCWFEESCEHCDTRWQFTGEVSAWLPMNAPTADSAKAALASSNNGRASEGKA